MLRLILTRHGETEWNLERRMQGQLDSPLTPRGISQAQTLRSTLSLIHFDRAYASPLGRARQTAEILLKDRRLPLITDARLREMDVGNMSGMTVEEAQAQYPEQEFDFSYHPERYQAPDGENYRLLLTRVTSFFEDIKQLDGTCLIVTHALVLRTVRAYFLSLPLTELMLVSTPGCCICEAEYTGGAWRLLRFGDPPTGERTQTNKRAEYL